MSKFDTFTVTKVSNREKTSSFNMTVGPYSCFNIHPIFMQEPMPGENPVARLLKPCPG